MNDALIKDGKRAASILERIPAGRWGLPEDFAGSIVYLASRASLYVSGEIDDRKDIRKTTVMMPNGKDVICRRSLSSTQKGYSQESLLPQNV
jgi:hypothetical protein